MSHATERGVEGMDCPMYWSQEGRSKFYYLDGWLSEDR